VAGSSTLVDSMSMDVDKVASVSSGKCKAWQGLPPGLFCSTLTHTHEHRTHMVMGAVLLRVWAGLPWVCPVLARFSIDLL
jgi:hypothetical protein